MVSIVTADAKVYIPMAELVDTAKERERIQKELEKAEQDMAFAQRQLDNTDFISKAPEKVVNSVKEKRDKNAALIRKLTEALASL